MLFTLTDVLLIVLATSVATLAIRKIARRLRRRRTLPPEPTNWTGVEEAERMPRSSPEQFWRQSEALLNFYREIDGLPTLPPMRNWAINPDNLTILSQHIRRKRPRLIYECGCGSSTVAIALLLRAHGVEGRILSFDNHAESVERTREHLAALELDRFADIHFCDMVSYRYPGLEMAFTWYALPDLSSQPEAGLLFVDGPPGLRGRLARYPAGPELIPRLAPGASIFVDDALRADEIEIVRLWCAAYPGLTPVGHDAEKGLVELVVSDDGPGQQPEDAKRDQHGHGQVEGP